MLDVHVIVLPKRDKRIVDRCLDSVTKAIANAYFPITLHIVNGIDGHIGHGRSRGYAIGESPYVTCVDDDDFLLPHAFAQMKSALEANFYGAVATPEWIERNGYRSEGKDRHHLIAYRREHLIDHAPWRCCGDVMQIRSIPDDAWIDLPERTYVHNVYVSPARLLRRENQDELKASLHG